MKDLSGHFKFKSNNQQIEISIGKEHMNPNLPEGRSHSVFLGVVSFLVPSIEASFDATRLFP